MEGQRSEDLGKSRLCLSTNVHMRCKLALAHSRSESQQVLTTRYTHTLHPILYNSPPLHPSPLPTFAAAIASWLGMPCRATAEEQKTTEPPPVVIMRLTEDRRMLKHELRLRRIT